MITLERSSSGKKIDASILCLSLEKCETMVLLVYLGEDRHIYNCFTLCIDSVQGCLLLETCPFYTTFGPQLQMDNPLAPNP